MYIQEILDGNVFHRNILHKNSRQYLLLNELGWWFHKSDMSDLTEDRLLSTGSDYRVPILNELLNFNDRESYLRWRSDWITTYNTLVELQRKIKHEIKHPEYTITLRRYWSGRQVEIRESNQPQKQSDRSRCRYLLRNLLLLRKFSKVRAAKLRDAQCLIKNTLEIQSRVIQP